MKRHVSAVLSMVFGSALVFATVVLINRFADGPSDPEKIRASQIDFEKKEKPEPRKVVQRKPRPPKRTKRRAPAPVSGLSSLAGLDLGLPGFDADNLGDLTGVPSVSMISTAEPLLLT